MQPSTRPGWYEREAEIMAGSRRVRGTLRLPPAARGVVLFAHGSGSGRFSPRNQAVAGALEASGLGTLLVDLLEEDECADRRNVFDIDLLAARVLAASAWLKSLAATADMPVGYFGASTGAGAALVAAALRPSLVDAVVSRGGRPDLAGSYLAGVTAPTLLIVGGFDHEVLALNEEAFERLSCEKRLVIVPSATHLFPEPGALEEVARLAAAWYREHLVPGSTRPRSTPAGAG